MKTILRASTAAALIVAFSGAAMAQTPAVATTDLNVRGGPGYDFEVVGVLAIDEPVTVEGCLEGDVWCEVSYGGGVGWVDSDYLVADYGGTDYVVRERRDEFGIPIVEYEVVGSTDDGFLSSDVRTYVLENRYDPIDFEGEIVIGSTIPEAVEIREIPDYEYRYVYVDGRPVIVEPETRRVVYVLR
jgi:uncharacterized protein YraI